MSDMLESSRKATKESGWVYISHRGKRSFPSIMDIPSQRVARVIPMMRTMTTTTRKRKMKRMLRRSTTTTATCAAWLCPTAAPPATPRSPHVTAQRAAQPDGRLAQRTRTTDVTWKGLSQDKDCLQSHKGAFATSRRSQEGNTKGKESGRGNKNIKNNK